MKRAFLLAATTVLTVLLAGGTAVSQAAAPEHELYEFVSQTRLAQEGVYEHVVVGPQDNVYVSDYSGISMYAPDGTFIETWNAAASYGMDVDSRGNVYTLGYVKYESWEDREIGVQKYTPDGILMDEWGSRGTGDGQFGQFGGIAVDDQDNVYVADGGNDRIQKFSSEGAFLSKWTGHTDSPEEIAVDSRGHIYLGDDHRILEFTNGGGFVGQQTGFSKVGGISVDAQDNLYVADFWDDRVEKFAPDGSFVTGWGVEGEGDGQFNGPAQAAVDSGGNAYVVDYWNDRVQKFEPVEDTVAPESITQLDYSGNDDLTGGVHRFNKDSTLRLDGLDQGVGTEKVTYQATGAEEVPSTTAAPPARVAIDTEGKTVITHSATDRAGNAGEPETTTVILDKTLPRVSETFPEAGAAKAPRGATVTATFSEAMDSDTMSRRAFRFYEAKSLDSVPATFSYDEQANKAILNPKEQLKAGATYRVIVGVRRSYDLAYNPLDQNDTLEGIQPKKWGFTVED